MVVDGRGVCLACMDPWGRVDQTHNAPPSMAKSSRYKKESMRRGLSVDILT